MSCVAGKVVLITGGSEGYGKATAKLFYEQGAKVIIAARNVDKMEMAKREIGGIDTFRMDITDYTDWERASEYVTQNYGKIDFLINNAGGGVAIKDVDNLTKEEIDRTIQLNLLSVVYAGNIFGRMMKEQQDGTIINVASVCARQAWPQWSVYAAAKAGVLNFSKGLYTELQPYNVRVSCLIPAAASTGFQKNANLEASTANLQPEDIANTALYICQLPQHAVVEDVTVWGSNQVVVPL